MRKRPSHRDPRELQVEVCELCGAMVPQSHLLISEVEGLRGYAICDFHPFERKARVSPSHEDLQRFNPSPVVPRNEREYPVGGGVWFSEDGE